MSPPNSFQVRMVLMGPSQTRYDNVARTLHWLTVLLLIVQYAVAWTMPDIHRGTAPVGLIAWHLSIGTLILLVVGFRGGWRLTHHAPPPPATLPLVLGLISRTTHKALYLLLILLPLLGWANASSRGWPVRLFGLITLPPLSPAGSPFGHAMGYFHQTIAIASLVVVGLHVLGACYHQIVLRDRVVRRML